MGRGRHVNTRRLGLLLHIAHGFLSDVLELLGQCAPPLHGVYR